MFYVDIKGESSYIKKSDSGIIQGSRLGPILYEIYVSPLFDFAKMTNYVGDKFIKESNVNLEQLNNDMKKTLEAITKWLKKSGLKGNDGKTEICLFHCHKQSRIAITINNEILHSKPNMNVTGEIFDSKLNWADHVLNAISKTNKALHCIRQIKHYFTPKEVEDLFTSNVFSVLYYNAEIWIIPSLNHRLKQLLMSTSANALKICTPSYHNRMSYIELHALNNRATPSQMSNYKLALLLHRLINL